MNNRRRCHERNNTPQTAWRRPFGPSLGRERRGARVHPGRRLLQPGAGRLHGLRHAGHQLPTRAGGRSPGRRPHPHHPSTGGLPGRAGGLCQRGTRDDGSLGRALAGDLRHRLQHPQTARCGRLQRDRRCGHRCALDQAQHQHHRRHPHQRMRGPGLENRHQWLPRPGAPELAGGHHVLVIPGRRRARGTPLPAQRHATTARLARSVGARAPAGPDRLGKTPDSDWWAWCLVVGQRAQARSHRHGPAHPYLQHPLPPEVAGRTLRGLHGPGRHSPVPALAASAGGL